MSPILLLRTAADYANLASLLVPDEAAHLARLTAPRRRRDWLLGRAAMKEAVVRLDPRRRSVAVLPDADGAPCVDGVTVSVSHRDGLAVAVAEPARDGRGLGVDLDRVEPRPASFAADWLTEGERALLPDAPLLRDRMLTAVWCTKEAVLKAARKGLSVPASSVEVTRFGPEGEVACRTTLTTAPITARAWHLPGYVIVFAAIGDGDVPGAPWPARVWEAP